MNSKLSPDLYSVTSLPPSLYSAGSFQGAPSLWSNVRPPLVRPSWRLWYWKTDPRKLQSQLCQGMLLLLQVGGWLVDVVYTCIDNSLQPYLYIVHLCMHKAGTGKSLDSGFIILPSFLVTCTCSDKWSLCLRFVVCEAFFWLKKQD